MSDPEKESLLATIESGSRHSSSSKYDVLDVFSALIRKYGSQPQVEITVQHRHSGNNKIQLRLVLDSTREDETLNLTTRINSIHTLKII
jgi:hypothetical protein